MKVLLCVCFSLLSFCAFSQRDSTKQQQHRKDSVQQQQRKKDSLSTALQKKLEMKKGDADKLMVVLDESNSKMKLVAKSNQPGNVKIERFKQLAEERDKKIEQLLTKQQVVKLRETMEAQKNLAKSRAVKKEKPEGKN